MPNDKKKKDIALEATKGNLGRTEAGFKKRAKSKKERRREKREESVTPSKVLGAKEPSNKKTRKTTPPKKTNNNVDLFADDAVSDTTNAANEVISGEAPKTPEVSSDDKPVLSPTETKVESPLGDENVIPFDRKEAFDPTITGGGVDENGMSITPKTQLINSIINENQYNDDKPLSVKFDEIERAGEYDRVLSEEASKAKVFIGFAEGKDPMESTDGTPPITVNDIMDEQSALLEQSAMEGIEGLEAYDNYRRMLDRVKSTPIDYGLPALERLGLQDYYPDINTPLQVGAYSGSIIGSNPIFVGGGGYVPMGIIDARRRSLERAAQNRVKQGEKIKNLMLIDSAEQYQDKMHEYGLSIFNKYGEMVGWDYMQLQDQSNPIAREFQKEYREYESNALRSKAIQTQYEQVLKDLKDGRHVPDHVINAMDRWQSGSWSIEDMMNPDLLMDLEKEMKSYSSVTADAEALTGVIQKNKTFFGNIPEDEADWAKFNKEMETIRSTSDYDALRTGEFKWVPIDRIMELVDDKIKYGDYYNPEEAAIDMVHYLDNMISDEISAKYMMGRKGGGASFSLNINKDVTQAREGEILGMQDAWRSGLAGMMGGNYTNDLPIMDFMERKLEIAPVKDENGNFVNHEIRGNYPLSKSQADEQHNHPIHGMRFHPVGSNESLTLEQMQTRTMKKNGYDFSYNDLMNWKLSNNYSENELMTILVKEGFRGRKLTPEDAWILTRSENSNVVTTWSKKEYTQKYKDQSGDYQILKTTDAPDKAAGSVPFNEVSGQVIDTDWGSAFGGFTFSLEYNLTLGLGDQPAVDSQGTDVSREMKKESGHHTSALQPHGSPNTPINFD
jgi:hypothetical protein